MDRFKYMLWGSALMAAATEAGAGTSKGAAPPPPNGADDQPKKKVQRAAPPSEPVVTFGGIEMPAGPTTAPRAVFPFESMSLGEMFFVEGRTSDKFQPYAAKYGRTLAPKKFMSRDIVIKADPKDNKKPLLDEKGRPQLIAEAEREKFKGPTLVGIGCWRTV